MKVRCKFHCHYKDEKSSQISLAPVYTGSPENKEFFAATPGGTCIFYTVNKAAFDQFEVGKEYYIDISTAG